MKVQMDQKEIADAIVAYLAERGVITDATKLYLTHNYDGSRYTYQVEIRDVELPLREGPYR